MGNLANLGCRKSGIHVRRIRSLADEVGEGFARSFTETQPCRDVLTARRLASGSSAYNASNGPGGPFPTSVRMWSSPPRPSIPGGVASARGRRLS